MALLYLMPATRTVKGERGHAGQSVQRARLHANKREGHPLQRLAWSILVLLPCGVSATEVYRSVDENGLIVYSDRPSDVSERVDVRPVVDTFSASSRRDSAGAASEPALPEAVIATAQNADAMTPDEAAAERARNCRVARERAETFSVSRRLFRTLPDGERQYLSDAEIEAARARAQSDVANWCD